MQQIKLSESTAARRRIPVYLVDETDGKTPETGITVSTGDLKLSKNGATESNHSGTWTEVASGLYYYEATSGELNTVGFLTVRVIKPGVRTFVAAVQIVAFDPYDGARLGLTMITGGIKKNTALNNFAFVMIDSADNVTPKTGLTVTAQRSIDGGAFAACANSVTEIGNGAYRINLATTDVNGDTVLFRFTATGALATVFSVVTDR
jgi:hypothetical protein